MSLSFLTDFRGEFAALGAALIWAVAAVVYTGVGRQLSPLVLNLVKGGIAIALLLFTLMLRGELFPVVSSTAVLLLSFSGGIGIGIGDTAYFSALNRLGARRTLILESLAPPLSALFAMVFLQERLTAQAWCGIFLTILGVVWVVAERVPDVIQPQIQPLRGILYGLLAALCQASGAVLSRAALAGTDISPLWSAAIRIIAGMVVLLPWIAVQQHPLQELKFLRSRRLVVTIAGTAFASTYLGIWLQQTSLKYAATGIAQSLTSTSPLFVLPIAIAMGERISLRSLAGVLLAIGGIWLLFSR
ncbi:DMT family transporter [Kovacikia minuta CCNUW1]|uniref:DMT family transporter n=1 Tax=Kovacikia minuta TaxID=2931930 RepID=UPI001CCF0EE7|nr:DMT family transporter [Kovacikia minuta]UBF25652.1 DMT family transporter [Kovacikia minuta CCNUW1]